jgi:transglutaminase-like putative cysteine protease
MIRLAFSVTLDYQIDWPGADLILNIQPAHTRAQRVVQERLHISQPVPVQGEIDPATQARHLRLQAQPGPLQVQHEATVEITHHRVAPATLAEVPVARLPFHVLPYLYPSRYCESDRLHGFAVAQFGTLWQGYARVQAICDWVSNQVVFRSASSIGTTSACDTLASRQGVCRDFAHLMIALCRAVNIPARFATGFDFGADPILGPPDFHAYVEVYLGDRWYLFDPSGTAIPMGFVRLATGRDAADGAFATLFGPVRAQPPRIHIAAVANALGVVAEPVKVADALSTDDGRC